MKKTLIICGLAALCCEAGPVQGQAPTGSSPARNSTGTGANVGQNPSVSFGTNSGPTAGIGQQGTGTAIPTQGGGIGIGAQGNTAIGQQGGTANAPQTNGFIINPDGAVTALPAPGTGLGTTPGIVPDQPGTGTGIPASGSGTALTPLGGPSTTAPRGTAFGRQGTNAFGQGTGTALGRQNTTAIGQQGTGTSIAPLTNGFIVNSDGSLTGLPAQGGSSGTALGGTNTGFGTGTGTNPQQTNSNAQP